MKIHDKIFKRIKELGMTQKEFSEKTGIPQSTISDWKGKNLNPAVDKIMIICNVLGMTPNELLAGAGEKKRYKQPDTLIIDKNGMEYEIIREFRSMNDTQKQRLMGYVNALKELN